MNLAQLFVDSRYLQVDDVQVTTESIVLTVRPRQPHARCPRCRQRTTRVHSRYVRQLTDVPWQNRVGKLVFNVRRFVCEHPCCAQQIFCERLEPLAAAYARRTQRLSNTLTVLGVTVGGKPGVRVAQHLGISGCQHYF
jgi:transposase